MILNLVHPKLSDIDYKLIHFSDSHTHIDFSSLAALHTIDQVVIKTRLASLNDVFTLLQATSAIRSVSDRVSIDLIISYLICGRYDRPMHEGDSFDLKIISDLLVQQKYRRIVIYEPHSDTSTALTGAVGVHIMDDAVRSSLAQYLTVKDGVEAYHEACLVCADLGGVKRVEAFAKTLNRPISIVYTHKDRDILTGEIKGIKILNPQELKPYATIYDDLCDGGRTFKELGKEIKKHPINKSITLATPHGIFSKGFDTLRPEIGRIITSNSYQEFEEETAKLKQITVVKVI